MYFDTLLLGATASLDDAPADLRATAMAALAKGAADSATRASAHYDLGFLGLLSGPLGYYDAFAHFQEARSLALKTSNPDLCARASRMACHVTFYRFIDEARNRIGLLERDDWLTRLDQLQQRAQADVPDGAADAQLMLLWTITVQELRLVPLLFAIGDPMVAKRRRDRLAHILDVGVTQLEAVQDSIDPQNEALERCFNQMIDSAGAVIQFIDCLVPGHELSSNFHLATIFCSANSPL